MIEDKILLTARYVEGDMDATERSVYEGQMNNDAVLLQHFKDYNYIHESLKSKLAPDQADLNFKGTLKGLNQQYFKTSPANKTILLKPYIKWLGSVAAILLIGLLIFVPWQTNFYDTYNVNSQMAVAERGAEKESNLDKAAGFYNSRDYKNAKILLSNAYLMHPENAMVAYYYGNSMIKTAETTKGRAVLNQIYKGESAFKYDAAYDIAMSFLKENKRNECKEWLQKIPEGTAHYKKASELAKKL